MRLAESPIIDQKGYCPICATHTRFVADSTWFRDSLTCELCGSVPRERALFCVIEKCFPDFVGMLIHEFNPVPRGFSSKLETACPGYTSALVQTSGNNVEDAIALSERLCSLPFTDNSLDLVVTQDVMGYVLTVENAFREIERVLKPGGAHLFTTPLIRGAQPSEIHVHFDGSSLRSNSLDENVGLDWASPGEQGSLRVTDWGFDICEIILKESGMATTVFSIENVFMGIVGQYNEVLLSKKPVTSETE